MAHSMPNTTVNVARNSDIFAFSLIYKHVLGAPRTAEAPHRTTVTSMRISERIASRPAWINN